MSSDDSTIGTNTDPDTDSDTDQEPPAPQRRRRKRRAFHMTSSMPKEQGEEWMLTYMDTVTLLVTLFVILLSFASFNEEKFNAVAEGLSLSKYGSGILTGTLPSTIEPAPTPAPVVDEAPLVIEQAEDMADALQSELSRQGLADLVDMTVQENVVNLKLSESVLFSTGEADLTEQGLSVILRLVPLVTASNMNVSVEGHTDNIPITTERFPSNWELSASRAASVARQLIDGGAPIARLHIRGYAATQPLASNATVDGRSQNRRVNLVLSSRDGTIED